MNKLWSSKRSIMEDKGDRKLLAQVFTFILILLVIFGIIFRFVNLDQKIVWHDEALSISRVSGYYAKEINQDIFNGQVIDIAELKSYQAVKESSENLNIIDILAKDNPQHPPIYYLLLRFWVKIFGNSLISWRSLSALFSVLTLPCVFLLCLELKESFLVSLIATAIIAVSPISILYAQEAREYSLWILASLISSILLLRAVKRRKTFNWLLYGIFAGIGLYIFPFSLFIIVAHCCYLIGREGFRLTKNVQRFTIALLLAIASFVPWAFLVRDQWSESGTKWTTVAVSPMSLIRSWGNHLQRLFLVEASSDRNLTYYLILSTLLILIGYCFYLLVRYKSQSTWLFIICLSASSFLPLAGADLLFGGQRSISTRYLLPSLLGLKITLALGLGYCFTNNNLIRRNFAAVCLAILLVLSFSSSTLLSLQQVTWNKGDSSYLVEVAEHINKEDNSLIVGNSGGLNFGNLLALSHLLREDKNIKLLLVDGWQQKDYENIPILPQDFDNLYFLSVSSEFQDIIEQRLNQKMDKVHFHDHLNLKKISLQDPKFNQ